jgi:predicted nucleotidyltransferase
LDVAILVELSRLPNPVTVGQLRQRLGRGSDRGVRLALNRLVKQGVVFATSVGNATVYAINDQHLIAPAVHALADVRSRFLRQLRELIATWSIAPEHASLFGSAARRDGTSESDIDLLIVRPGDIDDDELWREQLDELATRVRAWTGNNVQISDLAGSEVKALRARRPAIVGELEQDAVDLAGVTVRQLLHTADR